MTYQACKRVFLSYAREDAASARQLREDLDSLGVDVWFDERSLLPGQNWRREIRNAIRAADFFVLILSKYSVTKRGVIQREVRDALDVMQEMPEGAVFIVPARIERVEPNHELLRDIQWVDLFEDWAEGVRRIGLTLFGKGEPTSQETELLDLRQAAKSITETIERDLHTHIQFVDTSDTAVITANPSVVNVVVRELLENAIRHVALDATGNRPVVLEIRTTPETVTLEIRNRIANNIELTDDSFRRTVGGPGSSPGYGLLLARHAAIQYGGDLQISTRSTGGNKHAEFVASLRFPKLPPPGESRRPLKDFGRIDQEAKANIGISVQRRLKESEEARFSKEPSPYDHGIALQAPDSTNRLKRWVRHLGSSRPLTLISTIGILILGIVLGTWWVTGQREQTRLAFQEELTHLNHSPDSFQPSKPSEIDFTLHPQSLRDDGELPTIPPLAGVRVLRLHLSLFADKYQSYQGKLTKDGRTVASIADLPANIQDSGKAVIMRLPTQGLASGDYVIELSGTSNGTTQKIADYFFRLPDK